MKTYKQFISEVTATVNVDRRSIPAQATSQSVSGAVDRALSNPGQAQSASSATGRDKTTVGGSISFSKRIGGGGGDKKEKKEKKDRQKPQQKEQRKNRKPEPPEDPKVPFKDTVEYRQRRQQNRLKVLQRDNKLKTKYRYAVPSSVGGRWGNTQASGANQMSDWEDKGKNRTGGTNFVRTKVVGDPMGSGGTGRTISQGRYDRLFGPGGKYEPPTDGTTKYPSTNLGRKFDPKGYQPNKFVR